jgi:uncharacterized protein YceK
MKFLTKRLRLRFDCLILLAMVLLVSGCGTIRGSDAVETGNPGAFSADANVLFVRAQQAADTTWTFEVTVEHPDTGWDNYADGWNVVLPDGTVVKPQDDAAFTRLLLHPHETEQPFTRSQSKLVIPAEIATVTVRAHDLVDGYGGREVVVDLTQGQGLDFEVERLP